MVLFVTLIIALIINLMLFIPAYFFKTDKLTDLSYAISFGALTLYVLAMNTITYASLALVTMILLWSLRIGIYLFIRINRIKKDNRFDEMRHKFLPFLKFWILQGFTVWVILIPSILFLSNNMRELTLVGYAGAFIWGIGLIIETISDLQKYKFISNSENKNKWIQTGLWKYSRHPNYFGEIILWCGIYIYTLKGLSTYQALIGLLSPFYIAALLIFVSGIPILEKTADKKWGQNRDYQKYKQNTPALIPFLK